MKQIVIIGAGAAGLLAAGFSAGSGCGITVLDKNARPGRKVLITGKGRCNVTNNCAPEDFLGQVRTNPRFLYSAIHAFSPQDAIELFERLGVPVKTERGNRVFPQSDQAADIVAAMVRFAQDAGARLRQRCTVREILTKDGAVCGVRLSDDSTLPADAVLIAAGGCSYPLTGSNGDGFRLAEALGHTIVPARASLVPIELHEHWCAEVAGLAPKNVTLTLRDQKGKAVYSELGEMLFTHFGVSGPLVLSASAYMSAPPKEYMLEIDFKPGLDLQKLDARLLRDFAKNQNRDFQNALDELLPRSLIPIAVRRSGIPPETKVHSVTREQRRAFCELLKAFPLHPKALRPLDEAVITAGGVSVRELDPRTMRSKLVQGLFFAGEVIDVDAFTGGYNLQIAYATAYLAAQGMADLIG